MASYSLYDVVVPTYTRGLNTFEHILRKAEVFAKDKGIDADAELVPARLVADQLPLVFQVQNATKSVAVYTALLTGTPVHAFENTESTFADLYARLDAARALLATITPELAAANADKTTTLCVLSSFFFLPSFLLFLPSFFSSPSPLTLQHLWRALQDADGHAGRPPAGPAQLHLPPVHGLLDPALQGRPGRQGGLHQLLFGAVGSGTSQPRNRRKKRLEAQNVDKK